MRELFGRSAQMLRDGQLDALLSATDSLLAESLALPDSVQLIALRAHRARQLWRSARPGEAEIDARASIEAAEAFGDSALLPEPLFVMAQAIDDQGRPPRVVPWLQRLVALGHALGDSVSEARGRVFLARRALREGQVDAALEDLAFARRALADTPEDLTGALLVLGLAHAQRGEWEAARSAWQECARISREIDLPFMEAGAVTNLGALEGAIGDPAAAARALRTAHAIYVREGRMRAAVVPGCGSASQMARLGDFDAAHALLEEILQFVRAQGLLDLEPMVLQVQGGVFARQESIGRAREALALGLDRALALDDAERAGAIAPRLARLLAARDSAAVALELLEDAVLPLTGRMRPTTSLPLRTEQARLLMDLRRADEAVALADEVAAEAGRLGLKDQRVQALQIASEAELARGDLVAARARVTAAIDEWESLRQVTTDPQWRETMGESGPALAQTAARGFVPRTGIEATPDAIEELWSLLQRLRTRTLVERMRGPTRGDQADISDPGAPGQAELATVRSSALGPGDLLLEVYWGPQEVLVFWIDRERCELRRLEHSADLRRRADSLRLLLERPAGDTRDVALEAARQLGMEIFGDWALRLQTVRRVFYSPEGPLFALPLDVLVPALADCPLRVPSAALLVEVRNESAPATGFRVVEGTRNEQGEVLGGARREVQWLVRRFGAGPHETGRTGVRGAGLLHVAAHTRIDDQAPWRSAILIDGDASGGGPQWWAASEIAGGDTVARVAVLAGCSSATGHAIGGEGMLGLAHAFLSSGTSALVATLWPVDDATAARFSHHFYEALAGGESVTAAVASARRTLRGDPQTSHPAHWAPWVVIGQRDVDVELSPRWRTRAAPMLMAGTALALLAWASSPRHRRPREGRE